MKRSRETSFLEEDWGHPYKSIVYNSGICLHLVLLFSSEGNLLNMIKEIPSLMFPNSSLKNCFLRAMYNTQLHNYFSCCIELDCYTRLEIRRPGLLVLPLTQSTEPITHPQSQGGNGKPLPKILPRDMQLWGILTDWKVYAHTVLT